MKLINTSGNKTFKIIPREFTVGTLSLKLTSESTNKTITVVATSVIDGNYISFDAVFGALTEGDFYILSVVYSNNIIYKDKIFCTDQAINQSNDEYYSVNKNQYISEESSDNEFIII
tara:strand:- start:116 stop:466 length:351 start_codon:yes stop_codon:yes gene_type:complete